MKFTSKTNEFSELGYRCFRKTFTTSEVSQTILVLIKEEPGLI